MYQKGSNFGPRIDIDDQIDDRLDDQNDYQNDDQRRDLIYHHSLVKPFILVFLKEMHFKCIRKCMVNAS